ncbi:MAG: esterase/lipase family protein [Candidatus Acidiferrales bacterium]
MPDIELHHLVAVPNFPGSFALLADGVSPETAVIFVHGFAGDSSSTWSQFQSLIDVYSSEFEWWQGYDTFFYKYPSISQPVAVNADDFLAFSRTVFPYPAIPIVTGVRGGPLKSPYRNLVLVGHSEGAVVIRRALVEAYKIMRETTAQMPFPDDLDAIEAFYSVHPLFAATTILFGPAYLGFSGAGWIQVLLHFPKISGIFQSLLSLSVAYVELQKESPVLRQLKDDTEDIVATYPYLEAFKAFSIFGKKDRIVYIGEYMRDHAIKLVDDHNHISVCKPTNRYKDPLRDVRYATKRKASRV